MAVLAVGGALLLIRGGEPPRAREYREVTACLLTGASGITEEPARTVWAGLQDVSTSSATRVRYLEVDGPQTPEYTGSVLAGLVDSGCAVVVGVGPAEVEAIRRRGADFPSVTFLLVGSRGEGAPENVTAVPESSPEELRGAVHKAVDGFVD